MDRGPQNHPHGLIRPRDTAGKTLRCLATDLVAEIRQLDRRIAKAAADIQTAVTASGTTLTELCGIGALTAGKILGRVGTITRFRSAAAFATYTGAAPIDVSSGDIVRHRLSRAGDRQLNLCLHVMALTQIRQDTPGKTYYLRKRSEGKSHKEAMRCLKRRLSDVVYRRLIRDAAGLGQAREDTRGRLCRPARPAETPHADSSDKSLPGPTSSHHTTDKHRPLDTERRRLPPVPASPCATASNPTEDRAPITELCQESW